MPDRILVIDDVDIMRESLRETLGRAGYAVSAHASPKKALRDFEEGDFSCVVTDLKMPEMDGIEVLAAVRDLSPEMPVILITAHGTVESAVSAMKQGAVDYITKPFKADEIELIVSRAIEHRRILLENEALRRELGDKTPPVEMVGESDVIRALNDEIAKVAASSATVLVRGESGVGKELVARLVHEKSARRAKPFLCVNCAALSAGLLESELFGHEKGAFTGADRMRRGRFELADGGTLLLDEVSEIEPHLQAKLLRVLQEKSFERVGSSQNHRVDVRVIATTNRPLETVVKEGKFREDLYFRLNVLPVRVPPLRDRRSDIPLLTAYFLKRAGAVGRKVSEEALKLLAAYAWPGNIRELGNVVERAVVLSDKPKLEARDFELRFLAVESSGRIYQEGVTLAEVEDRVIREALQHFGGHRAKTAEALGIGLRTLTNKIQLMKQEEKTGAASV